MASSSASVRSSSPGFYKDADGEGYYDIDELRRWQQGVMSRAPNGYVDKGALQASHDAAIRNAERWNQDYESRRQAKFNASASAGSPATGATTDGNASNPNFSWNNEDLWNKAKEMSQTQLDNTLKTMGAASGYRASELRLNDEITRGQAQQQFGFNKQLADDNYGFQLQKTNLDDEITRRQTEQRFGFERTLAQDNYAFRDRDRSERERAADEQLERQYQMKRETTASARDTASRAFFGGGNRYAARR